MTEKVEAQKELKEKPKPKSIWSVEEKKLMGEKYGCELLIEAGDNDQINDRKLPTDTMISLVRMVFRRLIMVMELLIQDSGDTRLLKERRGERDEGRTTPSPNQ